MNSLSAVSKLQSTHCVVACRLSGVIHRLVWQTCGVRKENDLSDKNIKTLYCIKLFYLTDERSTRTKNVYCEIQCPLPVGSRRGLLGAELTCRWTVTEVGVMLKEAWRAILAFLRSWPVIGCVASGGVTAAAFTVFPIDDDDGCGLS